MVLIISMAYFFKQSSWTHTLSAIASFLKVSECIELTRDSRPFDRPKAVLALVWSSSGSQGLGDLKTLEVVLRGVTRHRCKPIGGRHAECLDVFLLVLSTRPYRRFSIHPSDILGAARRFFAMQLSPLHASQPDSSL